MELLSAPILGWGNNDSNQCNLLYLTYTNIKAIACGAYYSIWLKEDGTIVCWGNNDENQCDQIHLTYTNIISIACGYNHSVGLKEDGTIVCSR